MNQNPLTYTIHRDGSFYFALIHDAAGRARLRTESYSHQETLERDLQALGLVPKETRLQAVVRMRRLLNALKTYDLEERADLREKILTVAADATCSGDPEAKTIATVALEAVK